MTKYIFSIEESQKLVSNDNLDLKRIKLKPLNGNSEIEFCYTNFGTCSIYKDIQDQNKDKVLCWISDNTHHSCTSERMLKRDFDFNNTKAEVVLDDNCEYRISLSDTSNGTHIILPRSLILNKNLNLKDYYNKEIKLIKGEKVSSATEDFECYTPRITYEGRKICELDPVFVAYNSEAFTYRVPKSEGFYEYKPSRPNSYIAIEKKENELLAYFADFNGNPIDMLGEHAIGIDSIDKKNFNTHLRSELLEHSNIREVLPELREVLPEVNVDNSLYSDTRQLSCWINKTSTIQKIATDESFKNSVKDLLKSDPEFIKSVKGERGPQGPPGGKGEDASPEEVAEELTTNSNKRYKISSAVKSLLNRDTQFKGEVRDLLKSDKGFRDSVKGDPSKNGESPPVDAVAQELITTKATELGQAILNVKHDDREILANNQALQQGVAAQLMNDDNRNTLVTEVAKNEDLRKSVAGNQGLRDAVAIKLKKDETFQTTVKGDSGKDGESPPVDAIAQELITNKANELGQAVLEAKDDKGKEILVNNPILQEGVAKKLRENPGKTKGPKGEQGEPGLEGKPGKDGVQGPKGDKGDNNAQQNFALQKGEKLLDDVYEANIVLNDKTIATLPKIGYYTLNDQLVVHNHVTRKKVVIPEEFHYLKVVRLGSGFGDSDYKLTFCNVLGNEFFEYKKYDPEYSRVPDEYKFISLSHAKKEYNPNLSELISHQPLFFIKKGPAEPGSDKYAAAVFELTHNGKGKKMATLVDEFGYFDQNDMFKHCNYHEETKCRSYTSAEIDKEYQVTGADSEFYLTEHDNVIIHTIPELI